MTLAIAILCLAAGGAAMAACDRRKARLLQKAVATTEKAPPEALRFPCNEVLLGLLLVLAILYFTTQCLFSGPRLLLEFGIGYLAALLTSYGSYQRLKKAIGEQGLPKPEPPLLRCLAGFCGGMALFLVGALTLARLLLIR